MPKIPALPPMTSPDGADQLPIEDVSTTNTKYITLTRLKEWLQSLAGWVTTAMIGDNQVTFAKTSGLWWEEVARTTLSGSSDTISVSSIPARTHLRVIILSIPTGGTVDAQMNFNGDTANNYALRVSNNGAADTTSVSRANWTFFGSTASSYVGTALIDIINLATSEKIGFMTSHTIGGAGAANAPDRTIRVGKWANTTARINGITLVNTGTGDFAAGSEIIVLGRN